jgi:hypothetical protein
MGILVDLPNSTVDFQNPKNGVPMGAITNMFICTMHAFEISFSLTFDPDPKKGVGGSPASMESWSVGIVQNVIHEMINFQYDDGSQFKEEFKSPVLDSIDKTVSLPFYGDPVFLEACKFDPTLPCGQWIPAQVPVMRIFYTSSGYGELLDPWDASGVHTSNKPDTLNMGDEPNFGARLRLQNGALIKRAEHVMSFQTWLVAQTPAKTLFLAHVPAFSLVFWMDTLPSPGLLSIGTPPFNFAFYGEAGVTKTVKSSGTSARVRMGLGNGGRNPIMTGDTANTRGRNWLKQNSLMP